MIYKTLHIFLTRAGLQTIHHVG